MDIAKRGDGPFRGDIERLACEFAGKSGLGFDEQEHPEPKWIRQCWLADRLSTTLAEIRAMPYLDIVRMSAYYMAKDEAERMMHDEAERKARSQT